jgi:hypothetical protein
MYLGPHFSWSLVQMGKYMLALFKEQVLSRKKEQGGEKIKNIALDESPLKLRP